jgi:hypothetical protein
MRRKDSQIVVQLKTLETQISGLIGSCIRAVAPLQCGGLQKREHQLTT